MRFIFLLLIGIFIRTDCLAQLHVGETDPAGTINAVSITKTGNHFFSASKNRIGVFDRDTIMAEMPEYKRLTASLDTAQAEMDSITAAMNAKVEARWAAYCKDSANLNPLQKSFELLQIEREKSEIIDYVVLSHEQFERIKAEYVFRCTDKIVKAAAKVLYQKDLGIVMDKKAYADYLAKHPRKKAQNVSNDIRSALGI
jgi:Skp family chaperone for outer membrane proteins